MSPPSIANLTPSAGSIMHPNDVLCFDLTLSAGLASCQIWVGKLKQGVNLEQIGITEYLDSFTKESVFTFGGLFTANFLQSIFIPTPRGGLGYRFQLRRLGGWRYQPVLEIKAIDTLGQEGGLLG